jgi:hypothetical protein
MENDQMERVQAICLSMEESARPGFDDNDIENLRILVRITVQFYDYLTSTVPSADPSGDRNYVLDRVFFHVESFRLVMHSYGVLVGATPSTIDWNTINLKSVENQFISTYHAFVRQMPFEDKCRLLLDLVKLQIVFAGVSYDC